MPRQMIADEPLGTKSLRFTTKQIEEMDSKYTRVSSFLFRRLFEIFEKSAMPGAEIIKLRKEINLKKGKENGTGN